MSRLSWEVAAVAYVLDSLRIGGDVSRGSRHLGTQNPYLWERTFVNRQMLQNTKHIPRWAITTAYVAVAGAFTSQ